MLREDPQTKQPLGRSWPLQKRRGGSEHTSSGTARRAVWLGRRACGVGLREEERGRLAKGLGCQAKERSHHIQRGAVKSSELRAHTKEQCLGIAL